MLVVSWADADLLPISPPPEEEQAALPRCCHHQLPGALCLTGGPSCGLRPLHAPAVSDQPAAMFLLGDKSREAPPPRTVSGWGHTQPLCFAVSSPMAVAFQSEGMMLISGLFSSCCFFKALSYGRRGSSFGVFYLLALVLPSSYPGHGPSSSPLGFHQRHSAPCPPAGTCPAPRYPPCSHGPLSPSLQEHPVSEEHHPLEPDHSLHPAQCHVVRRAAHNEPRGA